jgi:ribosomal protein L12E/L44/L45/RPP1/RPP2
MTGPEYVLAALLLANVASTAANYYELRRVRKGAGPSAEQIRDEIIEVLEGVGQIVDGVGSTVESLKEPLAKAVAQLPKTRSKKAATEGQTSPYSGDTRTDSTQ